MLTHADTGLIHPLMFDNSSNVVRSFHANSTRMYVSQPGSFRVTQVHYPSRNVILPADNIE